VPDPPGTTHLHVPTHKFRNVAIVNGRAIEVHKRSGLQWHAIRIKFEDNRSINVYYINARE
jgi:hypothetical protein